MMFKIMSPDELLGDKERLQRQRDNEHFREIMKVVGERLNGDLRFNKDGVAQILLSVHVINRVSETVKIAVVNECQRAGWEAWLDCNTLYLRDPQRNTQENS